MHQIRWLLVLVFLCTATGFGQSAEPTNPKPRTVTVRGTGTVSAEPDQVRLSMQVTVRGESASMAMTTASRRTKDVLDLLKSHGVEAKDIQTTRVAVSPVYDYEKRIQPPPIVGYTAGNDFTVLFKSGSMKRFGEFLDKAVEAGASNFGSLIYESSGQKELEEKALGEAAKDAKSRAEVLASQLGARAGRILSVAESGMSAPSPIVQNYMRAEAQTDAPVMTGEMKIVARVDAVFELLEP